MCQERNQAAQRIMAEKNIIKGALQSEPGNDSDIFLQPGRSAVW